MTVGKQERWPIAMTMLAITIGLPSTAISRPPSKELLQGINNYKLGNFEKSIASLKKVLKASRFKPDRGKAHLYLALNYGLLQKLDKTRLHILEALKATPTLVLPRKKLGEKIFNIYLRVRKTLAGTVEVAADVPGAKVLIDNEFKGTIPFKGKVGMGRHILRIISPDGKLEYRDDRFILGAREYRTVMARLEPIKAILTLQSRPIGASITISGKKVGLTPMLLRLKPGMHRLELTLNRYQMEERTIKLRPGEKLKLNISLNRVPGLWPWKPPPFWKRKTTWSLISLGVGVVMSTLAIVYAVNGYRAEDAYTCGKSPSCWMERGWSAPMSVSKYTAYQNAANTFHQNSYIFGGVAGAAGITAVVLFFLRDKPPKRIRAGAFNFKPVFARKQVGMAWEMEF